MSKNREAAPAFKNSSASQGANMDCIEGAHTAVGGRGIRDSKDPNGPFLLFDPTEWKAFTTGVKGAAIRWLRAPAPDEQEGSASKLTDPHERSRLGPTVAHLRTSAGPRSLHQKFLTLCATSRLPFHCPAGAASDDP
ncbi:DUF397 domain-containing protein [Streptomyces sp. NPDC057623]|uniref:DUF397 domain-containing protein n=1 Tax=Streptomyces sp. NPDC057623 TaxID=3346187 RepID=UPI0036BC6D01